MSPSARLETESVSPAPLGEPLRFEFSGLTAPNRFMKAAMTERLSSWDPANLQARGIPSDNLVNVYRKWGEGQFGIILSGNIMIEYDHLEAAGNAIIPREASFSGERFEQFKKMGEAAKAHGSLFIGQVSHPGRQVGDSIQANPVSASDVQLVAPMLRQTFAKPHAATEEEIKQIIDKFAHAAEYLHKAGWDGIQLHGAHGYLLAQFLAETTNKRTDKYGGSLENRQRIIMEIAAEIRKRVPKAFSISIKVNSVEFQEKGFSPEDCAQLCSALEENGFDFVELSGGTYESLAFVHKRESSRKREAFFLDFADQIVPRLDKTKAYVVGGLRSVSAMVQALKTVHGVSLGRSACQEFDLPAKMLPGKVSAAINPVYDSDDFMIGNMVAGTQIRQVGKGQEPMDMSVESNFGIFQKSMGKWMEEMGQNADGKKYGYIDLVE